MALIELPEEVGVCKLQKAQLLGTHCSHALHLAHQLLVAGLSSLQLAGGGLPLRHFCLHVRSTGQWLIMVVGVKEYKIKE